MTEVIKLAHSKTEVINLDLDANVKEISDDRWAKRSSKNVFSGNPRFKKDQNQFKKDQKYKKRRTLIESVSIPEKKLKNEDLDDIDELDPERVKTKLHVKKITKKKETFRNRIEKKVRAELLNKDDEGGLVTETGKKSYFIRQKDITDAVDIASATKNFNLDLDYGPYKFKYTRNGRHLLLGGQSGHLAAFDWLTKSLHTEINVTEKVNDVVWLHNESMFAVAQKRWTYIYDKTGVELHCLKSLFNVHSLEFLPRHFLLAALSNEDMLSYMDTSTGQMVQQWRVKVKNTTCLTQNQSNAILVSGNTKGVVAMWSPNNREPLVELLTHKAPLSGIAVNKNGQYMATVGLDKQLKIWDLRNYKELGVYKLPFPPTQISISQTNQVAVACGVNVHVYQDTHIGTTTQPYLHHRAPSTVSSINFCPYEDVLGIGHLHGFESVIIPGSGDPNFDALQDNPFESKKQRREKEVRNLLDKLQPETISMDPSQINKVNKTELEQNIKYRDEVMHWKDAKSLNVDPSRYYNRKKTFK